MGDYFKRDAASDPCTGDVASDHGNIAGSML